MVYVDKYKTYNNNPFTNRYGDHVKWCHLFADDLQELHDFALKLGLRLEWFQNKKFPHYDITLSKRNLAISLGAQEINLKDYLKNKQQAH